MHRYERNCRGSGRCVTGCPNAAKQGMNVSYVPWALALGARIYASCRVERVVVEGGRATGVLAHGQPRDGRSCATACASGRVAASSWRASTVQTPNVLRRSGLRARAIGEHFQCHPGYGVGGVFDEPVSDELRRDAGRRVHGAAQAPNASSSRPSRWPPSSRPCASPASATS